jgi:hypothetical protein
LVAIAIVTPAPDADQSNRRGTCGVTLERRRCFCPPAEAKSPVLDASAWLDLGDSSGQVARRRGGRGPRPCIGVRWVTAIGALPFSRGGEAVCGQSAGSDQPPPVVGTAQISRSGSKGGPLCGVRLPSAGEAQGLARVARVVRFESESRPPDACETQAVRAPRRCRGARYRVLLRAAPASQCPAGCSRSQIERVEAGYSARRDSSRGGAGLRIRCTRTVLSWR